MAKRKKKNDTSHMGWIYVILGAAFIVASLMLVAL